MANIWLTSDWHLDHDNIIKHCKRPFELTWQMNQQIVGNFCNLVKKKDLVYYLGDFAWRSSTVTRLLPNLPGRWTFILGNHDERHKNLISRYVEGVERLLILKMKGCDVTLCHYPMASWHKSHYQAWNFHGHCHGNPVEPYHPRRIDVGIDCWDFQPVHIDELINDIFR